MTQKMRPWRLTFNSTRMWSATAPISVSLCRVPLWAGNASNRPLCRKFVDIDADGDDDAFINKALAIQPAPYEMNPREYVTGIGV